MVNMILSTMIFQHKHSSDKMKKTMLKKIHCLYKQELKLNKKHIVLKPINNSKELYSNK